MQDITGEPPKMWGPSIVGFGTYHYVYESGREGDVCVTGFSPRAGALVVYLGTVLRKLIEHSIATLRKRGLGR
jgi:hypothetical protein